MRELAKILAARGYSLSTMIMMFHTAHNVIEQKLLALCHELFPDRSGEEILAILGALRVMTNKYVHTRTNAMSMIYVEEIATLRVPGDPALLKEVKTALQDPKTRGPLGATLPPAPSRLFTCGAAAALKQNLRYSMKQHVISRSFWALKVNPLWLSLLL
ncbi:hypothetical protein [Corynebacterium poyangense]|uniref:hypothetical protein n=1 Tax=Corynebacterium poyangense TaxID=2684405 RepID=UPI00165D0415|nr:hypothetical protein [Corynebacterium poyangense]